MSEMDADDFEMDEEMDGESTCAMALAITMLRAKQTRIVIPNPDDAMRMLRGRKLKMKPAGEGDLIIELVKE